MVMVEFEAWTCVDPVLVLLSLSRVSTQWLCVNLGSCVCVSTLDLVPFLMN
jgi:hypothetical protein